MNMLIAMFGITQQDIGDIFPELRGFHITPETQFAIDRIEDQVVLGLEDVPFPQNFGCTQCAWSAFDLGNSAEHRAVEHSIQSGHTVVIVLSGGSQFFEQDRIDLEVRL